MILGCLRKLAKYEPGTKPRRQPARHSPPLFLLLFVKGSMRTSLVNTTGPGELSVLAAARRRGTETRRKDAPCKGAQQAVLWREEEGASGKVKKFRMPGKTCTVLGYSVTEKGIKKRKRKANIFLSPNSEKQASCMAEAPQCCQVEEDSSSHPAMISALSSSSGFLQRWDCSL